MGDALPITTSFFLSSGEDRHFLWLQGMMRLTVEKVAPAIGRASPEGLQRGFARLIVAQSGLESLLEERERASRETDHAWRYLVTLLATGTATATALKVLEEAQALSAQTGGQDDAFFSNGRAALLSCLRQCPPAQLEGLLATAIQKGDIAPTIYMRRLEGIYQRLPRERMDEDRLALEAEFWHFKSSFRTLVERPDAFTHAAPCLMEKMSKVLTLAVLADKAGDALAQGDDKPLMIARSYYQAHFERPPVRACLGPDPLAQRLTAMTGKPVP